MSLPYASGRAYGTARQTPKLIITNGRAYRSVTLSPLVIACFSVAMIALLTWCVGLSGFVFFRDDVVRSMMRKHAVTVEKYEDKITSLRLQVDSIRSRQFINQDSFAGAIDDLRIRQEAIETHQSEILDVVERARQAGISLDDAPTQTADRAASDYASLSRVSDQASHSVTLASRRHIGDAPISRPAIPPREALVFADTPDTSLTRVARQIDEELRSFADNQSSVLNTIEMEASARAKHLRSVFDRIKLDKKRFGLDRQIAAGGPFIAAKDADKLSEVSRQVARIDQDLAVISQLETAIAKLPIRRPMAATYRVSSSFGTRLDPFVRRRAFHSGIDFAAPTGAKVTSTASGRVTKASWNGGYGRMVEISHGNGLSTRYAHLSRISVSVGQRVKQGQVIGRVGSTGRSTGPHLHYETRVDGKAVNPIRFLNAL